MQLTVALCTYNPRPDLITRAVCSVVSQLADLDGEAEFVIVDNNSEPPAAGRRLPAGRSVEIYP